MKTNQILTRQMGDFDVLQRTSDGMFNATTLLKAWNQHSGQKKEVAKYFENPSTKEFVQAIIVEEFPSYAKNGDDKKALDLVYYKTRANKGVNVGTWMHPLLFIDFAMWLNPSFKVKVLRFVYDQLIQYRNEAGNSYKDMAAAICKLVPKEDQKNAIMEVARVNNCIVYGKHKREIRNNKADETLLSQLTELQKDICKLINDEFIKSFDALRFYLKKKHNQSKLIVQ